VKKDEREGDRCHRFDAFLGVCVWEGVLCDVRGVPEKERQKEKE